MVLGLRMCVIHVPSVIQCAETHRTALGRGSRFPSSPSVRVKGVSRRAFIVLPWPIKRTGIFSAELLIPDPINCDLSPTPPVRVPDASIMRQPCTPSSRELGFADVPRFSFDKLSGREDHTNARGMLHSARLLETIDLPKPPMLLVMLKKPFSR